MLVLGTIYGGVTPTLGCVMAILDKMEDFV